jgi:protein TonB
MQGLSVVASKLVLQARTEIDAGRFDAAEILLADARRLDPGSSELASSSAALNSARDGTAQQRVAEERAAEERRAAETLAAEQAAADKLAAEQAAQTEPAQTFAIEATAADALTDDKVEITPTAVAAQESVQGATADIGADNVAADVAPPPVEQASRLIPVAASALNRTKYVAPKYPRSAQRRGQSGWVEIEFTVDLDGSVQGVSVIASEPGVTFIDAAVTAVEKWKFEPVIENNIAVQKRATVRMMFAVE